MLANRTFKEIKDTHYKVRLFKDKVDAKDGFYKNIFIVNVYIDKAKI